MNAVLTNVIYLSMIVLLPVVPAVLLFRLFRYLYKSDDGQNAVSSDNFLGKLLNIKFSGPVALYVVIFSSLYYLVQGMLPDPSLTGWKVVGTLRDQKGHPPDYTTMDKFTFVVKPQPTVSSDGTFSLDIINSKLLISDGLNTYQPSITGEFGHYANLEKRQICLDTVKLTQIPRMTGSTQPQAISFQ